jgi:hypothetical protein
MQKEPQISCYSPAIRSEILLFLLEKKIMVIKRTGVNMETEVDV